MHFSLFLAAAVLLAITPGPGIFYVLARSLAGGRRRRQRTASGLTMIGLGAGAAAEDRDSAL